MATKKTTSHAFSSSVPLPITAKRKQAAGDPVSSRFSRKDRSQNHILTLHKYSQYFGGAMYCVNSFLNYIVFCIILFLSKCGVNSWYLFYSFVNTHLSICTFFSEYLYKYDRRNRISTTGGSKNEEVHEANSSNASCADHADRPAADCSTRRG